MNHARLCAVSSAHSVELTRPLQHLIQLNMLVSSGSGRSAVRNRLGPCCLWRRAVRRIQPDRLKPLGSSVPPRTATP